MPETESAPSPKEERSFEEAVQRLAQIVEELEGGELPLEQSLRLFEEGMHLSRASQAMLDRAERRVEELLGIDERGDPIVRALPLVEGEDLEGDED